MSLPSQMNYVELDGFGEPDVLKPAQMPVPQPGQGEVLVKVAAAGVNRPDVQQRVKDTQAYVNQHFRSTTRDDDSETSFVAFIQAVCKGLRVPYWLELDTPLDTPGDFPVFANPDGSRFDASAILTPRVSKRKLDEVSSSSVFPVLEVATKFCEHLRDARSELATARHLHEKERKQADETLSDLKEAHEREISCCTRLVGRDRREGLLVKN